MAPATAAATKMAVVPLRSGAGADQKMASSLSDAVVAEVRRIGGVEVITSEEIAAILGNEREKEALGCDELSCLAELGGALGADELLAGSVAKLGTSWLLHIKRIDVGAVKVVAQVDRRLKGGSVDDLLDVLPAMTAELMGRAPVVPTPGVADPIGTVEKPSPVQEVPLRDPKEREGLILLADGQGRYLAHNPALRNRSPLFFGDSKRFFKQRVPSSSRGGNTVYSLTVWDPRFADGYRRQFDHRDGVNKRRCGDEVTELQPVPEAEAKTILAAAELFEPRWTRGATFIAMDPTGRYFLLDQAREPRGNRDYWLFIGAKGALRYVAITDAINAPGNERYTTAAGQLLITYKGGAKVATWAAAGGQQAELQVLDLYSQARMIYTDLGAYDTAMLGTICDAP